MYLSSTGTFWRCPFSVCLLVLFDCDDADTLETLALVIGLSSVTVNIGLYAQTRFLCVSNAFEELRRMRGFIFLLGKMKRANSCTRWGFECFSFAKFFPGRSSARRFAARKTKEISICLQLTITIAAVHRAIYIA
jgi:hypothetical protein